MNFKKATLGQLKAILDDSEAGAGAKHMATVELRRRDSGAFKNTPMPFVKTEITKWAREKSGISITNDIRFKKL
jgi:hypothetical protein